jgi:hypothetical protein
MYDDENACYIFEYNVYVRMNESEVCVSIASFSKMEITLY